MAADPTQQLHALIDRLDQAEVIDRLEEARRRTTPKRRHNLPTLHTAPPLNKAELLRSDLFPADESADEFDATIRQWREEGSRHRS